MNAAVLSIGSELLRGDIFDTNSAFLARELSAIGCSVIRIQAVPDDQQALTDAMRAAIDVGDITVCSGGLGPTQDDLTRYAIAGALGEHVFVDEGLATEISKRFNSLRRRMPDSNRRQAELIPSAAAISNPNGTAPGWYVQKDGKIVVALPGPPREMEPMWRAEVLPRLEKLFANSTAAGALMTFGLGESAVEERIANLISRRGDVIVATYAKANGVQVHVTAQGETSDEAQRLLSETMLEIRRRLGDAVFGVGDESLAEHIGSIVKAHGMTLAVMESATGGALADLITNVEGSSDYFVGGVIAYTRAAKASSGVLTSVMDEHGLISPETARAMAEAIRGSMSTDIGIATTGIAGRDSLEGKTPGTCYIAVDIRDEVETREIHRPGDREFSKRFFAQCALDLLRRTLEPPVSATG